MSQGKLRFQMLCEALKLKQSQYQYFVQNSTIFIHLKLDLAKVKFFPPKIESDGLKFT